MFAHIVILPNNPDWESYARFFDSVAKIAVDSFFIVSGFLIFMSYERSSSIKSYTIKRAQRIYPAYITVILLTAIGLYFISSQTLENYFSIELLKYVAYNGLFLNFLHNWLPGVFEQNFLQAVDGALWTIKIEVMFYISVPIIGIFILKRSRFWGLVGVYIFSTIYLLVCIYLTQKSDSNIYNLLQRQLPGQLMFFISGAFLYYYFEHFKKYSHIYLIFALFGIAISNFISFSPIFAFALAIVIIYFATVFKYLGNWGKYGDFSYGIYIWHFPIIQIFISLGIFNYSNILAILGIIIFASISTYLSWNFVEKPFLRKKSHYKNVT
jgi:peptidoglycan/LPS O-acetylase OafA/YrhL